MTFSRVGLRRYPYPYHMARRWSRPAHCETDKDFALAVDVRDENEAFVLSALVPGLKASDLNIQILDDVVSIEGEFKKDESEYLMRELPHGSFRRSLRLSTPVEADKVVAKITDGLLTLSLPKAESARPKTIKVAAI
ncbi:MAG: Hsp20/alpha crystallin family protein [Chloroflexi bacterium]|nr:Hsp20/alpha crystallin family protein [Chloroflexota bacterium]